MKPALPAALAAALMCFPGAAFAGDYAPLNCAKAETPAEIAICRNYPLGQAEARMATLFGISMSLVAMGQRGDIGDAQLIWLKKREACGGDVACLAKAYSARIAALNKVMADIEANAPY